MTWKKRLLKRAQRGVTLTEMSISTTALLIMLAFGIPVFTTIGDAGDEGSARLSAQTENQVALLEVANELQNSSSTATDALGNARLTITAGAAAVGITNKHTGQLDGFRGTIGQDSGEGVGSGGTGNAAETQGTAGQNQFHSGGAAGKGSGHQGGTHGTGLVRDDSKIGATVLGAVAARPRQLNYQTNSILRFQKVLDYTIAADGSPNIVWGPQITYQVQGTKLLRSVAGSTAQPKTVARHVVAFSTDFTDMGTIVLSLVTQKQSNATGRVQYQANQIEISPKN